MAEKETGLTFTKMEQTVLIEALNVLSASKDRANTKETNEQIKEFRNGDIAKIAQIKARILSREIF